MANSPIVDVPLTTGRPAGVLSFEADMNNPVLRFFDGARPVSFDLEVLARQLHGFQMSLELFQQQNLANVLI
jgi:hypothetical protein